MSGKGARKEEILKGFKLYPSSTSFLEFNVTFADYFNLSSLCSLSPNECLIHLAYFKV